MTSYDDWKADVANREGSAPGGANDRDDGPEDDGSVEPEPGECSCPPGTKSSRCPEHGFDGRYVPPEEELGDCLSLALHGRTRNNEP